MKSTAIKFDLLGNATDSLRQAVELLALEEIGSGHGRLKHAITHAAHAIELLLKERLRRATPALIWENVDKFPRLDARTVTVETAISRLEKIVGVRIAEKDAEHIKSLRKTRNAIEHYEWETTEGGARVVIGNALSFAFAFAQEQLGIELSEEFRRDDTWRALLDELYEFAHAHATRIAAKMEAQGKPSTVCDECGHEAVPLFGGSCELCGHWQDADNS